MEANAKGAAFTLRQEKDTIFVTGDVTRETAPQLIKLLTEDRIYTLDFAGVERINFGGQRVLLHASQTGKKFNIVNAGVKAKAALSSTGVDTFISVLEKPVELSMQGYEIFGGGFNGDRYLDENSSIIFEKVNIIKDVRELEKEELKSENLGGLMNELWQCVDRMKKYNNTLNQSKKALIRFIG